MIVVQLFFIEDMGQMEERVLFYSLTQIWKILD